MQCVKTLNKIALQKERQHVLTNGDDDNGDDDGDVNDDDIFLTRFRIGFISTLE